MRAAIALGALVVGIFCCFTPAVADDWADYNRILDRYYFLDDQSPTEIVCRMTVSALDPAELRAQLQPIEKNVEVDENLDSFQLTYRKGVGILVSQPHFTVTLKTTDGLPDPTRVRDGVEIINRGVAIQLAGTRQMVESVFQEFMRPTRDSRSNVKVTTTGDSSAVEFTDGDQQVRQAFSGLTRRTLGKTSAGSVTYEVADTFTVISGKEALARSVGKIVQEGSITTAETRLQYQQLQGGGMFPAALDQQLHLDSADNVKQDASLSIRFEKCTSS